MKHPPAAARHSMKWSNYMEDLRMLKHMQPRRYLFGLALPRLAFALALLNMATIAMAGAPANITQQESALIPPYCAYTLDQEEKHGSPERLRWEARIGRGFNSLHHYCWGQINTLRALRSNTSGQERKRLLNAVLQDYLYVIRNIPRDSVLSPEIHTRVGEVELRLALYNEANKSFSQARALKPDYWPAYSHWAEFLIRAGQRAEAKQVVKSGLEYSPSSRVLREQYRLLGGNPSDIMPRVIGPKPDAATGETAASEANE